MFFRFLATLVLLTAVSLLAVSLEKQNLALKRAVSFQYSRLQVLREKRARLVLASQQLGAPPRLLEVRNQQTKGNRSAQTPILRAGKLPAAGERR